MTTAVPPTGRLVLADGSIHRGISVGAPGTTAGEAVFNTGMTGYQEVLSDPSYLGQIVTMTYPEIGNYGIITEDGESDKPQVSGFVMRRCCAVPSNFRASQSLGEYLTKHGIVAISEVDTRAITRALRVTGAMPAIIDASDKSDAELVAMAKKLPSMAGQDLASKAAAKAPYDWTEPVSEAAFGAPITWPALADRPLVVCLDLGIKRNILRLLASCGLRLRVVPGSTTSAEQILAMKPAGIFVSNGPGDPAAVTGAIATLKALIPTGIPIFGICLGHQLLGLALGAKTYKLKFGHRGANHPIKNLDSGSIEIASHNHGFAVDPASLPSTARMTHVNLNDQTCAGLAHRSLPVFSVQYHPEACPGPTDPLYLFRQFAELVAAKPRKAG